MRLPLALTSVLLLSSAAAYATAFEGTLGHAKVRAWLERASEAGRVQGEYHALTSDRVHELSDLAVESMRRKNALKESRENEEQALARWELRSLSLARPLAGTWKATGAGKRAQPIALKPVTNYPVTALKLLKRRSVLGPTRACVFQTPALTPEFVKQQPVAFQTALTAWNDSLFAAHESDLCPKEGTPEANPDARLIVECSGEAWLIRSRFLSLHASCLGNEVQGDQPVGAHPNHTRHGLVFDLQNGKVVPVTALFTGAMKESPETTFGKPAFYLGPLGAVVFSPEAPFAVIGMNDTIPYATFRTGLKRYGQPSALAEALEF